MPTNLKTNPNPNPNPNQGGRGRGAIVRVPNEKTSLSRKYLLTIRKFLVRPNLAYADIIYDKPFSDSFKRKIEMVHYKAALVILM